MAVEKKIMMLEILSMQGPRTCNSIAGFTNTLICVTVRDRLPNLKIV